MSPAHTKKWKQLSVDPTLLNDEVSTLVAYNIRKTARFSISTPILLHPLLIKLISTFTVANATSLA